MQEHIPLCLVRFQCFRAAVFQKVAVPLLVILIIGMVAFDMPYESAVPVP